MEFLLQQQANFEAREAAASARFNAEIARINEIIAETQEIGRQTRLELRRAVRLAVQEARAERKRRKEGDEKLAASHAALEASMKAYFDSLKRGQNGHDQLHGPE